MYAIRSYYELDFAWYGIELSGNIEFGTDLLYGNRGRPFDDNHNHNIDIEKKKNRMTELILHGANLDQSLPFGSLANLELSLQTGIPRIEVDVFPVKDEDFAMLHDPDLGHTSQDSGSALELTSAQIQKIQYKNSTELLGTLSQAVALLKRCPVQDFLQLDLKPYAPLTPTSLKNLIKMINVSM